MFTTHVETFDDMAVIECEGRIVRSDAAFRLRDAVTSQRDASIVVLDLSEVRAIEGGGLGMLVFLQRWASDHDVRLKMFNPSQFVRDSLDRASPMQAFEMASLDELMALLRRGEGGKTRAA